MRGQPSAEQATGPRRKRPRAAGRRCGNSARPEDGPGAVTIGRGLQIMKTARTRLLYLMLGFAFGLPLAAQSDCKVLSDASSKVFNTPAHLNITGTVGSLTTNAEMIYASGNIYMKLAGKWSITGTTKDMEQLTEKNRQSGKVSTATCRYLKDELVNGEMAAVYSMSDEPLQAYSQ